MAILAICSYCGSAFLARSRTMNNCQSEACLKTRQVRNHKLWSRGGKPPAEHPTIQCVDCGASFVRSTTMHKRCSKCADIFRDESAERWYLIRIIRQRFSSLAKVAPEEAEQIQADMIQEDGIDFKELALDGILERVKWV